MDLVELYAISLISPERIRFFQGESGYFRCITRNALLLRWIIGQDPALTLNFISIDPVGSDEAQSLAVAYLIERDVNNENRGTRSSILVVTPDPSFTGFIEITCDSTLVNSSCTITAEVAGKYNNMCEGEFA